MTSTPPRRSQRKRTKGWKMPPATAYVGRGSIWGNPFKEGEHWRHGVLRIDTGNVAFNTQLLKAFGGENKGVSTPTTILQKRLP